MQRQDELRMPTPNNRCYRQVESSRVFVGERDLSRLGG
jgi:hypothetical protein